MAFRSYVRFDDQHENGRLSDFCARLSGEVRLQTGEEFPIFQDRNDIKWGQQWKQRLEESIDTVTFLIPILSPGFFKSPHSRAELERFLRREEELNRDDLILPVYYVNYPVLENEAKREADLLAKIIAARQRADWRDMRFEPFTSPQISRLLAQMATQIMEALERGQLAPNPAAPKAAAVPPSKQQAQMEAATTPERVETVLQPEASRGPMKKPEPPTRTVDALHRGDYLNLTEALAAAKPGDRILVRAGLYKEGIVVDKPVEIIGDGELGEVVIEAMGKNVIRFTANMGRIANLTLRQASGDEFFCVDIAQGRLDLEGCDITSQSYSCVGIHGNAEPRLRRNRIYDGKQCGIIVYENGQGTLEDNDIFGNALVGVEIREGGNPIVRANRVTKNAYQAIWIYNAGCGVFEDNDLRGNVQGRGLWSAALVAR